MLGGWGRKPIRKVVVVVNPAAGSVTPTTGDEARTLLEGLDLEFEIVEATGDALPEALKAARNSNPDLLAVIAGDGTARAAAELCGPRGPLVAPLPGGTMNVLPKALYGTRDWKTALADSLADGKVWRISGGVVDGRAFFVAAILGAPALWAEAREAVRDLQPMEAIRRVQTAMDPDNTGKLSFDIEGHLPGEASAVSLLCPLISRRLHRSERVLEVAALDPQGAAEVVRLAFHALVDDWRSDQRVDAWRCRRGRVWADGGIPAVLDGEPTRIGAQAKIGFRDVAFRALVPREKARHDG
jgi:diacylglycerol kinase family enzyme